MVSLKEKINLLNKELEKNPFFLFIVMKGQAEDIAELKSDLDLRVVVDVKSYIEMNDVNNIFYSLYNKIIGDSIKQFKLFEHPPLILSYNDLLNGFGNINEICTWSFLGGDKNKFLKIKKHCQNLKFSDFDIQYYQKILNTKNNYDVEGELFYNFLGISEQKKYFLAWHYYSTSVYAFMSIILGKRLNGKSVGLREAKKMFPKLEYSDKEKLFSCISDNNITPEELEEELRKEWHFLNKKINHINEKRIKKDRTECISIYIYSMALFLNKIPRLSLYLNKIFIEFHLSKKLKNNLIKREIEDIEKIYNGFVFVLGFLQKNNFNSEEVIDFKKNLLIMKNLLDNKSINSKFLMEFLNYFKKYLISFEKFNDFLSKRLSDNIISK